MKHFLYLILSTLTINIVAQCPEKDKLKFGGTFGLGCNVYDRKTSQIQYFYTDVDTTKYCCHISKIQKYADFILDKSKKHIEQKAGKTFYTKLIFHDILVIYHDFPKQADFERLKCNLKDAGRISYWLTYSYLVDSAVEYGFGIELDFSGNLISEPMIPNISKNSNFENIIGLCQAIENKNKLRPAKQDSIESIQLNFDHVINSFIWQIVNYPNINNERELLYINANSGKLYKTEKEEIFIDY